VDVWLNSPVFPLEASGTSGMKAGMNGAPNLSILDGWWGEGYNGNNGWAIKSSQEDKEAAQRDQEESRAFYEILQDQIVPLYYNRDKLGYSPDWVKLAKHSMASILPRFNSVRMVEEYVNKFYLPASNRGASYTKNNFGGAKEVSTWKSKIAKAWDAITLRNMEIPGERTNFGDLLNFKIAANLNGLNPEDVLVELLMCRKFKKTRLNQFQHFKFEFTGIDESGEHIFELQLTPEACGKQEYFIRIYPYHSLLTHPLEMGMMVWL